MKKVKFLPLLCLAPMMLAACGGVSKPSFAKAGSKVEASEFGEKFEKAIEDSFFALKEEGQRMPSLSGKAVEKSSVKSVLKRDKKQISKYTSSSTDKTVLKYDSKNLVASYVEKSSGSSSSKDKTGSSRDSSKVKATMFYQKGSHDGETTMDYVAVEDKTFEVESPLEEGKEAASFDGMMAMAIYFGFVSEFEDYCDIDPEKGSLYINKDKVFTVEAKDEMTNDDNAAFTVAVKSYVKAQLSLAKKDTLKVVVYTETKTTTTYKEDISISGSDYFAGDVAEYERKESYVATLKAKKVSLKAKDISKFKEVK